MTGLPLDDVRAEGPALDETYEEGCEYQLVLRADPASQTSLLSTTIQATMLLGRVVDARSNISDGTVGRKVFVFADDLDVANRLYHDLADAEAYRFSRNRLFIDGRRAPLATFRSAGSGGARDDVERDADGQRWWAAEAIGHDLRVRLPLGRTTSQDAGVDARATVLIATASLEVGFNDPTVGFILQHKAPHGASAFLQRKGRAGRTRAMRPWMITALSDYGRDRAAFQSFEQLFDPIVLATDLPIDNLYVLRIQATYALLEWLFEQWREKPRDADIWTILTRPTNGYDAERHAQHREQLSRILGRLYAKKAKTCVAIFPDT